MIIINNILSINILSFYKISKCVVKHIFRIDFWSNFARKLTMYLVILLIIIGCFFSGPTGAIIGGAILCVGLFAMFTGSWWGGILCVVGFILLYCLISKLATRKSDIAKKKLKEQREIEWELYRSQLYKLIEKYGECYENIKLKEWDDISIESRLLIFKNAETMIINGKPLSFADIDSYSIKDYVTKKSVYICDFKVNTNSMENPFVEFKIVRKYESVCRIKNLLKRIVKTNKHNIKVANKVKNHYLCN